MWWGGLWIRGDGHFVKMSKILKRQRKLRLMKQLCVPVYECGDIHIMPKCWIAGGYHCRGIGRSQSEHSVNPLHDTALQNIET